MPRLEKPQFTQNKFVISTGAKRSGEICGFFLVLTQTPKPVRDQLGMNAAMKVYRNQSRREG
jgi:hypothetical protein